MSEPTCSEMSVAVGEPLAGSAVASTDRWLVIEHDAAWGPKGLEDSALPEGVVAHLSALGRRHRRLRVQLVRRERSAREQADSIRVYFADSGDRPSLHVLELEGLDALTSLPLEHWLKDEAPPPGALQRESLYLVCTHGKRDRCCALKGLPVHRALAERVGDRALQTTHLGGHRFAATLLTLPAGICYGRFEAREAEALITATERDELHDLSRIRGRTAFSSEAQAAEVVLRERLGELRLDALVLDSVESVSGESIRVHFRERVSGREHDVLMARASFPEAPSSCGASPKLVLGLVALHR